MKRACLSILSLLSTLALLGCLMGGEIPAQASVSVTVNGSNYTIPQNNEKNWGTNVTNWIQAISAGTLQPTGGNFTLTADTDFGANFGIKSTYYKSRSSNIASLGVIRLSNTDTVCFRNIGNSANLCLSPNASTDGLLQFNGVDLVTSSGTQTLTNKTISGASNTFSNIPNTATTATSANTVSAIVARDSSGNFSAGAITASGLTSSGSSAIGSTGAGGTPAQLKFSDYANTGSGRPVIYGNWASSGFWAMGAGTTAADSVLKIGNVSAAGTDWAGTQNLILSMPNARVTSLTTAGPVFTDASGNLSSQSNATAFGNLSPLTTKGDLLGFSTSNARLAVGTNGQQLVADSTQTLGVKWATESLTTGSASSSGERVERLAFGAAGGSQASALQCSSTPCTIYSQSGSWISSVVWNSTGSYTVNIAGSTFSATPTCTAAATNWAGSPLTGPVMTGISTSTITLKCYNNAGINDCSANVICMGPR